MYFTCILHVFYCILYVFYCILMYFNAFYLYFRFTPSLWIEPNDAKWVNRRDIELKPSHIDIMWNTTIAPGKVRIGNLSIESNKINLFK